MNYLNNEEQILVGGSTQCSLWVYTRVYLIRVWITKYTYGKDISPLVKEEYHDFLGRGKHLYPKAPIWFLTREVYFI